MITNLIDSPEDEIIEDNFSETDFTDQFTIYLNLPSFKIHRKLAHNKQSEPTLIELKAQTFNIETSDPELALLGGLQSALKCLDRHRVKNGKLRFYVPSAEIAVALNKQECTNPKRKQLWDVFFGKIKQAGHTVEAVEVDQDLADRQTEEALTIVQSSEKPEVWKPWPKSPDRFEASTKGNIRRIYKNGRRRLLKPYVDKDGYRRLVVVPERGGKRKYVSVGQMVLETYVGPRPTGHWVAHYDDNASNDDLGNLRWDTPQNNFDDQQFTRPKGYTVQRLEPGQKAIYWDHWDERERTMSG